MIKTIFIYIINKSLSEYIFTYTLENGSETIEKI